MVQHKMNKKVIYITGMLILNVTFFNKVRCLIFDDLFDVT